MTKKREHSQDRTNTTKLRNMPKFESYQSHFFYKNSVFFGSALYSFNIFIYAIQNTKNIGDFKKGFKKSEAGINLTIFLAKGQFSAS